MTSIDFHIYFHIHIQNKSRKYLRFHVQGQTYQFKALPFGLSTAPMEFTVVVKEVKLIALQKGIRIHQCLDDWLVRTRSHQTCLQHTQTLVAICQDLGWLVNMEKSELDPKQVFNFIGYQFDLKEGKVRPTLKCWQTLTTDTRPTLWTELSGLATDVPQWATDSHRKASPSRLTPCEAHTMALEKQLEGTRITRKGDPYPQVAPPPSKLVAGGRQGGVSRSTIAPPKLTKTCSANLNRRIKRRVGHSLRETHCKGNLVPSRKQITHELTGTKDCLPGLLHIWALCLCII